jgi:hypothetical protein
MSEHQRGEAHPMFGRRHSEESLAKMTAAKKAQAKHGPENPNWKGRFVSRGYVMISQPGAKAIPEHRLVMEAHLGRPLTRDEVVHHRNGVKSDNRIENLELHTKRTHKMTHAEEHRELRALRAEVERLRDALSKCSCGTSPVSG